MAFSAKPSEAAMSSNQEDGESCYLEGDAECRTWFEQQWWIYPERAHKDRTTNLSFHYGGVLGFRKIYGHEPAMNACFAQHVAYLDKHRRPHP